MAKIEHGHVRLLSVDTEKKVLRFREIRTLAFSGQPPAKEWEHPYSLILSGKPLIMFFPMVKSQA